MDSNRIPPAIVAHVEADIIPLYAHFDRAHSEDHVRAVIKRSMALWKAVRPDYNGTPIPLPLAEAAVYVIAAYHDLGLQYGREHHHEESARILLADMQLRQWFSPEQLRVMAEACEDHRASKRQPPRSIFGRIVAEADRQIIPETVVRRTIQFGLAHYPELQPEEHYTRLLQHLHEKYDYGGYLQLWLPQSDNATRLEELRQLIHTPVRLHKLFLHFFKEETQSPSSY